jgi:hypothetical protein
VNEYIPPVEPGPARPGVAWHQHGDAFAGDLLQLALMAVAGIGEHDLGIAELERRGRALGGADHRAS